MDALDPDGFVELDQKSAKRDGTAVYVLWPQPHARKARVDGSTSVQPHIHPRGFLMILPLSIELENALNYEI